ncbi:hypothetical protein AMTRI_Chr02g215760 [Amborella trichopoda]
MVPPLLVTKSLDSSEEDLVLEDKNWSIKKHKRGLVKEHVAKLLECMKVSYKREINLIEETIAPVDIPVPRPRRQRSLLQKEAAELATGLKYNPLSFSATDTTRRGKGFRPQWSSSRGMFVGLGA